MKLIKETEGVREMKQFREKDGQGPKGWHRGQKVEDGFKGCFRSQNNRKK